MTRWCLRRLRDLASSAAVCAKLTRMGCPSPLVGYNTNIRHQGRLYHVQTEDSGVNRPHVTTHLYVDGGRIIATRKSSYAEKLSELDYRASVKGLMKSQHKAMLLALTRGQYEELARPPAQQEQVTGVHVKERTARQSSVRPQSSAGSQPLAEHAPSPTHVDAQIPYDAQVPHQAVGPVPEPPSSEATRANHPPFGAQHLSVKSLDEVILGFLAEEE